MTDEGEGNSKSYREGKPMKIRDQLLVEGSVVKLNV